MDPTLQFVWGEYRAWAATARTLKQQVTQTSLFVLGLTLAGTAISTLTAVAIPDGSSFWAKFLGLLAAALLAIATYLAGQLLSDADRQIWVKARAAAEGLKSESFKYAAGVQPYDGADAAQVLAAKVKEAQDGLPGIIAESVPDADKIRGMPAKPSAVKDYLDNRFEEQRKFYSKALPREKHAVELAKRISMGLGLVAVILSASGSMLGQQWPAALLGVVTTAGAAIGAWFQGGHHQQLALMYQAALVKAGLLQARRQTNAITDPQFINDAEALFREEHAAWLGEWQTKPPNP